MRAGSTSPWRARAALSLAAVSLAALFLTAVSPGSAARAADGPAAGTGAARRPNIVVFLADDLGALLG